MTKSCDDVYIINTVTPTKFVKYTSLLGVLHRNLKSFIKEEKDLPIQIDFAMFSGCLDKYTLL